MLYLDKPIGPIRGMMIYGDHSDPDMFYYVPERPRLARNDGRPEFVFLKYKRDITDNPNFDAATKTALGGGFVAFTVDLGVEDDELKAIRKELGRFASGEVKLAPIQFRKGSVRLTITKDAAEAEDAPPNQPRGLSFFEEVYGTTKPSLFGFNRATFALVLSMEVATLFEAALRSGISPIGVIYELEFLGMRPAFDVRISANYHRVYSELNIEFSARGTIKMVTLGVDVGAAFQRLRDKGVIKVEVLNFTDESDLRQKADDAFNWFKTELLKEFFQSSVEPPAMMRSNSGGGGLLSQLTTLLGGLEESQHGSQQPQHGPPSTETPTPAQPPVSQSSNVASTAQSNAASSNQASSRRNGENPSPFQVVFSLKYFDVVEDKERVFEYSMQAAVAREVAPQGLFSTIVAGLDLSRAITEVSLDDEFFNRQVAEISVGGDLAKAGVSMMAVNLEYPGQRAATEPPINVDGVIFKPDQLASKVFTNWLNDKKDRSYRYMLDMHFHPDSLFPGKDAHVSTEWKVTSARQLTLDPLDAIGLLDVELSLGKADSAQVSQVQVELRYEDLANAFATQRTFVLKSGESGTRWRIRLSDRKRTEYQYRLTYFLTDGLRHQTEWTTSSSPSLVVNDPFQNKIKIRQVPMLDVGNLIEANVNIVYEEPETGYQRMVQTVYVGGGPALVSQDVVIPTLAKNPSGFRYDVTVVRADGSVYASEPQLVVDDANSTLVISDGLGRVMRVRIKLPNSLSDLTSGNLSAVKVLLTGLGAQPDTAEVLFTATATGDQTVILAQPAEGPLSYAYSVVGYNRVGIPVQGASGRETGPTLIVPMLTLP